MFNEYSSAGTYDELISAAGPRRAALGVSEFLERIGEPELRNRQRAAECDIRGLGITFTVYDQQSNIDREWPLTIAAFTRVATSASPPRP